MTTTLRPIEPLQHAADGSRSRRYQVCVNSRPVGRIHLGTRPDPGAAVARVLDLRIDEPDRRRGRATVAALAAEEVARGWGCRRIETSVPADAGPALRLTQTLGYVLRNRSMTKPLDGTPPALPEGSRGRPMTEAEYEPWKANGLEGYAQDLITRGVPEAEAYGRAAEDYVRCLPRGVASAGSLLSVLEHEGTRVGTLWLWLTDGEASVYDVETDAAHRGRGHGRTLMLLAEAQAVAAGKPVIALNVFAGNVRAECLYDSLGYETTVHHLSKPLL
ncbi:MULTISPECIES: GNAT family N-acetyltransferase [Streptomyces]|uniref:GNAT family N-acetyltransferase n=2 Tax=Streptomyces griseiscabiei TaxID=2993540 RepID=A0ABU4LAV8_9ACTN|nr:MULTISPECIES: GNAT family N-acetyltransferase [Streptomyces]MBZ3902448.1 GNAT family N-acetyltransferase [Streptomyces griseiscabiei]MDX2912128.1 GNAT family N-acetyltransferase [Streptomyces griseiscabiei]